MVSMVSMVLTPPPASPERAEQVLGFGARLLGEFDALLQLSPLGLAIWLSFVFAVAWALAWGGPALVRLVWRVGMDPRRRLGLGANRARRYQTLHLGPSAVPAPAPAP